MHISERRRLSQRAAEVVEAEKQLHLLEGIRELSQCAFFVKQVGEDNDPKIHTTPVTIRVGHGMM